MGVTVKTLQRWEKEGKLIAYRNPKGRRFYTQKQYDVYMGETKKERGKTVLYARVSNRNQKDDLKKQVDFLRQFVNANGVIVDEVIEDVGSGLNYKRKKWHQVLDDVMDGKVSTIYVTHKDRFIRFGTEIVVVNNESFSPQEEMIQDLIAIIHVFSCRIYGLRKYKKNIKEDDEL